MKDADEAIAEHKLAVEADRINGTRTVKSAATWDLSTQLGVAKLNPK